jgi:glycosyltransferase involved in cell wall biosynthesis
MDNNLENKKLLKICILSSFPPNKGGESTYADSYVKALNEFLKNKISQIHVITFTENKDEKTTTQISDKIVIHRVFNSYNFSKHFSFFSLLGLIMKLRPDFIHCEYSPTPFHSFGGLLGEPLLILFGLIRKILRIPIFVTLHTVWLPHEVKQRATEISKNKLVRILITKYFILFIKAFARTVDKFYMLSNIPSNKMMTDFCTSYNISSSKVDIELHGIWKNYETDNEVNHYNYDERINDKINIRCLGFINPYKGYEYALYAMKIVKNSVPKAFLTIAGDFTPNFAQYESKKYIEKLNEIIRKENISSNAEIIQKYLTKDEFEYYIKTSSIILLPYSRVVAASGILHEAISNKIPVILAGSGAFFSEMSDFLPIVPAKNADLLGEEIVRICTSEEYQEKIKSQYHDYIETHDWSKVVHKVYEDYVTISRN